MRHPKPPMIYCNSLIINLFYVMAQECAEVRKNRRRIGRLPFRLSTIRFQKNGMLVCCFSEAPEYLILSDLARRLRRKKARSAPLFGVFRAFSVANPARVPTGCFLLPCFSKNRQEQVSQGSVGGVRYGCLYAYWHKLPLNQRLRGANALSINGETIFFGDSISIIA